MSIYTFEKAVVPIIRLLENLTHQLAVRIILANLSSNDVANHTESVLGVFSRLTSFNFILITAAADDPWCHDDKVNTDEKGHARIARAQNKKFYDNARRRLEPHLVNVRWVDDDVLEQNRWLECRPRHHVRST